MSDDSPWLPRRERERKPRGPGSLRYVLFWVVIGAGGVVMSLVVNYLVFGDAFGYRRGIPVVIPLVLVAGGIATILFLQAGSRLRERRVRRLRPGQAIVTMRTITTTINALDRLGKARLLGLPSLFSQTYAVSIGPESLEVWGKEGRRPLVIPYRDILRATVGVEAVEYGRRDATSVELLGSVELELSDGDGATIVLPLVPKAANIASLNDDRVEYFVEQLSLVTELPWVDAETPPDPEGASGVSGSSSA